MILYIALYFLPLIIAAGRGHNNTLAIGATNLLLGWTVFGWIAACIWSFTSNTDSQHRAT